MDNLKDNLSCPICLEYCKSAMECAECHNLFCKECSGSLKVCPLCRKLTYFNESHFARRMISALPAKCLHCRLETTMGELQRHLDLCEKAIVKCPYCHVELEKWKIMEHFAIKHKREYFAKLNKCIRVFTETENKQISSSSSSSSLKVDVQVNPVNNRNAFLGANAKFYCGGALDGQYGCQCCYGACKPNGCNCSGCMQLDLKSRNLPKGWLVNRDGCLAQYINGVFYCGRNSPIDLAFNFGVCSPLLSPNCLACRALETQVTPGGRYYHLL